MTKCPKCNHLIDEEPHVCPSALYLALRDALVETAARAQEILTTEELDELDELERSIQCQRQ